MARLIRPTVTWLLALVMPFQVLTAVYLDVRGPAHFHAENDDEAHGRTHAPGHAHGHAHSHGQDDVQRHHHHPDDPSVVTVHKDGLIEPVALETKSGWSGTMLVAILAGSASPHLPNMQGGLTPGREPLLQTRFLGRLERPPRINPA